MSNKDDSPDNQIQKRMEKEGGMVYNSVRPDLRP